MTNYVTAEWTLDVVQKIFAALDPHILKGLEDMVSKQMADQYRQVVVPHIDANIKANFARALQPILNQEIDKWVSSYLKASVMVKGERMVITKHDKQGRFVESVKIPLWANAEDYRTEDAIS